MYSIRAIFITITLLHWISGTLEADHMLHAVQLYPDAGRDYQMLQQQPHFHQPTQRHQQQQQPISQSAPLPCQPLFGQLLQWPMLQQPASVQAQTHHQAPDFRPPQHYQVGLQHQPLPSAPNHQPPCPHYPNSHDRPIVFPSNPYAETIPSKAPAVNTRHGNQPLTTEHPSTGGVIVGKPVIESRMLFNVGPRCRVKDHRGNCRNKRSG